MAVSCRRTATCSCTEAASFPCSLGSRLHSGHCFRAAGGVVHPLPDLPGVRLLGLAVLRRVSLSRSSHVTGRTWGLEGWKLLPWPVRALPISRCRTGWLTRQVSAETWHGILAEGARWEGPDPLRPSLQPPPRFQWAGRPAACF